MTGAAGEPSLARLPGSGPATGRRTWVKLIGQGLRLSLSFPGHGRSRKVPRPRKAPVLAVPLLSQPVTRWMCPNCDVTDVTRGLCPNRFHTCAGLHMLTAPLVREGLRAKVEAGEREDFLRGEIQATGDDGKPYMNVRTTYADHDDLAVNAGLATGKLSDARDAPSGLDDYLNADRGTVGFGP